MAINRFDTPARTVIQETFVPQTVPAPFAELNAVLQQRQKTFDENELLADNSLLKLNVNAIEADKQAREEEISKTNIQYDDLVSSIKGDFSMAGSKIKQFARNIDKELRAGRLAAIQSRYDQREGYRKQLEETELDNRTKETLLGISDNLNSNLEVDGKFQGYQGIPGVEQVNAVERGGELVKGLAADGYENMQLDPSGRFLQTKGGEYVTWDRAFRLSYESLLADAATKNSIKQDIVIDTYNQNVYPDEVLDAQLDSIKKSTNDPSLKKQINSIKDLSYAEKLAQVKLLTASFTVADKYSYSKTENKLSQLSEFTYGLINPENPTEILVQVPSVSAAKLNTLAQSQDELLNELRKEIPSSEIQSKVDKKVDELFTLNGIVDTDSKMRKQVGPIVATILTALENKTTIDRESANYKSISQSIPNFDSLPDSEKDIQVVKTLIRNYDELNAEPTLSLANSGKEIEEVNLRLFGNKKVINVSATEDEPLILNGEASLFTYRDSEGRKINGSEFVKIAQNGETKAVTNVGVSTNLNNPIEYGSTMLALNDGENVDYYFIDPPFNVKNSDNNLRNFQGYELNDWGTQQVNSAKYSPTNRKVFNYKGNKMESVYNRITDTFTLKAIK